MYIKVKIKLKKYHDTTKMHIRYICNENQRYVQLDNIIKT